MVKVTIEMDGKKVFEQENEFIFFTVGSRDKEDKGWDADSGIAGLLKDPTALPGMVVKGLADTMKQACEDNITEYIALLAIANKRIDEILEKESVENGTALKSVLMAAIKSDLNKGEQKNL